MDAQLKSLEVESAIPGNHDFTIEDATGRQLILQRRDQFWKVAIERFLIAALDEDVVPVPKDDSSKSVPFGLKDPPIPLGKIADPFGEHWGNRRIHGQVHSSCYNPALSIPLAAEHLLTTTHSRPFSK